MDNKPFRNESLEVGDVGIGENADGTFNSFPASELAERTIARDILEKAWAGAEAEVFGVPAKATQASVNYRLGTPTQHCGICAMFVEPDNCTSVEGDIKRERVCDLFGRPQVDAGP